jgi:ribosomal protein S18 acetylase RimI-like enzyme
LCLDLEAGSSAAGGLHTWTGHAEAAARLFARAYEGHPGIRAFAPNGTMAEWREYVGGLLTSPGCGRFMPGLSFVMPHERHGELAAAIMVTDLGPSTSHIAQMAVDPDARGLGLGERLVRTAAAAAAACAYTRMTLLVARSNRPAVGVYERLGFRDRASFVVATWRQPTLSTSLALATGGDKTRR